MNNSQIRIRIIIILLLGWGLWTFTIGDDFYIPRDTARVWVVAAARNYNRYGIEEIGGSIVRNAFYEEDTTQLYKYRYSHHPPLAIWLPAIFSQVAGESEMSLRFVFPVALILGACLFYVLARRLFDDTVAFWALCLYIINPMISYLLNTPTHDTLGFTAFLLYTTIFLNWLKSPSLARYTGLIFATLLCTWAAWPAVFFVGVIGIFGIFFGQWKHRIGVFLIGIISIISIVTMLLLYEYWGGNQISSIMNQFFLRVSTASHLKGSEPFTIADWLWITFRHISYYGTFGILILGIWGTPTLWRKRHRVEVGYLAALFISGLLYITIFRNASYNHDFYKAVLMPALCISAAIAIVYVRKQAKIRTKALIDGLFISVVLQSIFVVFTSVNNPYEANLKNVVSYINNTQNIPKEIYVTLPYAPYRSEHALQYYTDKLIYWNTLAEELPETNQPLLYIFCYNNQNYVESFFEQTIKSTEIDDMCSAYILEDINESS